MMIIHVAGHLGRDPETRFTASGLKVTNITVAANIRKGGKDETVWWRLVVFGDRFDKMIAYLKKGSPVIAIGQMNKPEIWTDKEGRPQVSCELVVETLLFSPFGKPDQAGQNTQNQANQVPQQQPQSPQSPASYGTDTSTGFGDFGGGTSPGYGAAGTNNQFATAQGTSPARFGQTVPHNEEQLPF